MNKKLIIPIVAGIATVGVVVGVTYAFFSARVTEENKTETIIKTNTLGLTYTGETEINASNMIPGDSFTKTFSVENTSNVAVTYNIYMKNVLNEFNEDLVYTLTDEVGNVIEETALPETKDGKTYLKTNINIAANSTKTYTLKIEYKYLDTPQNDYQGKTFTTTVGIDTEQLEEPIISLNFDNNYKYQKSINISDLVVSDSHYTCFDENQNTISNFSDLNVGNHKITCIATNDDGIKTREDAYVNISNKSCVRAMKLHSEKCTQTNDTYFCSSQGYAGKDITYGNIGIEGTLRSGDAFDCDVNDDGKYNSSNERFYYVSDYYNPNSKAFENSVASLIYYNDTFKGQLSNDSSGLIIYSDTGKSNSGPTTAATNLPTKDQWPGVTLYNAKRQILNQSSTIVNTAGNLGIYDYSKYSSRLLTYQEVQSACGSTLGTSKPGQLDNCVFLQENTSFSGVNYGHGAYWIETTIAHDDDWNWAINAGGRMVSNFEVSRLMGVRPVIDVAKDNMEI